MDDLLDNLQEKFKPIFLRYNIQKAIVFGSFSRNEPTRRIDLDLILVLNTKKRFFDRYEGIQVDLTQAARNFAIDLFIYTPQELETIADRPFIAAALREGKVIYESK